MTDLVGTLAKTTAPYALALLVALASFVPSGGAGASVVAGPYLMLCIVVYWAVRAPARLPPVSVFAIGLAIDLLTAGPPGFWALLYLIAHGLGLALVWLGADRSSFMLCIGFAGVALSVGLVSATMASLYYGVWTVSQSAVFGPLSASVAFALLVIGADRLRGRRRARGRL